MNLRSLRPLIFILAMAGWLFSICLFAADPTAAFDAANKFYDPAAYTDKEWADWMTKMNRKSKLKREQEELLARYLETFRSGKTNAVPPRP